ncbi:MAG TPA: carboxypeptidase-like regulatory domain-containing protein [Pyrinomonadaceae bacterium]|nr:carboxypeptidase-like regulatory domain-containing protein [Pyrinomonadaceae bacterium]
MTDSSSLCPGRKPALLSLLFITLFLLAPHVAMAQDERSERGRTVEDAGASGGSPGTITGRVVGEDGRPMNDVPVVIYGFYSSFAGRGEATDSAGRFQFKELPPGLYGLRATSPSLIEQPDENRNPWDVKYFRPGEAAQLTLVRGGVVTGAVMNSQGEPVIGVFVRPIRVRDVQGRRLSMESMSPFFMPRMTDDRGIYRLYGLLPGSYLLVVGGNNPYYFGGGGMSAGDVPTYYPSSTRDTASEVLVRAGEETTGVDIRYRGERGHTVSGTVSGINDSRGRFGVGITLLRAGTGIFEGQTYATEVDGKRVFSLSGVPDGEYEIISQGNIERDEAAASVPRRITVRGADVPGLQLDLSPLSSISGRITLEPLKAQEGCTAVNPQTAMLQTLVRVRREEQDKTRLQPAAFSTGGAAPNEQGEFLVRNLSGGLFRMSVSAPASDWYVRAASFPAATQGAKDKGATLAPPGTVSVKRGERAAGINIALAQGAASLKGRVVAQAEGAVIPSNLRVYLVPSERERADDVLRYDEAGVSADGSFSFTGLAPGRYLLLLRPYSPPNDILQPPRMLAWDEEGRKTLRREAEAANNGLELKPCQQLKDYSVSFR